MEKNENEKFVRITFRKLYDPVNFSALVNQSAILFSASLFHHSTRSMSNSGGKWRKCPYIRFYLSTVYYAEQNLNVLQH